MNIERAAGYCLIGTGLFAVTGFIVHPHDSTPDNQIAWLIGHSLIFSGLVLNLIGLSWAFASDHEQLGKLGWCGFALAGFGLSMYIGKLYWSGLLYPFVLDASPDLIARVGLGPGSEPKALLVKIVYSAGAMFFALGHLMLGIALLRSQKFPRKPVLMLMSGAFMVGVWPLLPGVVQMLSIIVSAIYAAGLVWLGASMIKR
jgi:uncharacterized membrane protein